MIFINRNFDYFRYTPFPLTDYIVCLYAWTNVQNEQNRIESTAIIHKVRLVRDLRVKRTIHRNRRDRTGFEVVEVVRGVHCGLIKVAVT